MSDVAPWDRPLIGPQMFTEQVWCGGMDEAMLLSEIVGWAVGSRCAAEGQPAVADLKERGYIRRRLHVAPIGSWEAYALTDKGFDRLAQIGYGDMHDNAVRQHRWLAERGSMGEPPGK